MTRGVKTKACCMICARCHLLTLMSNTSITMSASWVRMGANGPSERGRDRDRVGVCCERGFYELCIIHLNTCHIIHSVKC